MTTGRGITASIACIVALMFIASPFAVCITAGVAQGAAPTLPAPMGASSRADEPVVFMNSTNSSGLGPGYRPRIAWGDYNNDGYDDLLFGGWELWRNNGNGSFTDVSPMANLLVGGARGGVWGDYDNDGYLDIYQLHGVETDDRLFHNNRDGTFTDVTYSAGQISDKNLPSEGAAWGDYDLDGFLDLYVANYEWPENSANGTQDILYHNDGDGTFTNITADAGIGVETQCGRGVVWADYDSDGWPDIYVANYRLDPNFLWHNNGNGTFTEVSAAVGVQGDGAFDSYGHSIGADFADVDNDGDLDLFVANLAHPRFLAFSDISKLYINSGEPDYTFTDVPIQTRGIAYEETHSDPGFADYDNDGDQDLYITSVYDGRYSFLYRNDGNGRFTDVTAATGTSVNNGWGAAWSDFNNDGFQDLYVGSGNSTSSRLFENAGNSNHWIRAELRGTTSNSYGIGARVELEFNGSTQIREVQAGKGTTSQSHGGAHFGLGSWKGTVDITIKWPSGILQKVSGIPVDQVHTFIEPPARTDFRFRSVTFKGPDANMTVLEGAVVNFTLEVENLGTIPGDAQIELSIAGAGAVGTYPLVQGLAPFQNATYQVDWNTAGMGGDKTVVLTIVKADPTDQDTSNNDWRKTFHVNARPVSRIILIDPPIAYQLRDSVEFKGQGTDDGEVIDAQWSSDLDGVLSSLMNFTIPASDLSTGVHTISFKVKDDHNAWSAETTKTLMIEPPIENKRPDARIINIEPNPAKQGEPVSFEGEGSDPDGSVKAYRWESSIDGELADTRKFTTTELSPGTHRIEFYTVDDKGAESKPATMDLVVKPENLVPTAVIEIIDPNPAEEGEKVRFQGRGIDTDGTIETFLWTSSIDGVISYDYDFSYSDLSVGKHSIGLKVKDDQEAWSAEVFKDLEVMPINEKPSINITSIVRRDDGTYKVRGNSEDNDGNVVVVQVRIGADVWLNALPVSGDDWSEWYFIIDPKELDLSEGPNMLYARAFDGTDYSEDVSKQVDIKGEPTGFALLEKIAKDTLSGNNIPCLFGLIVIIVIIIAAVWNALSGPRRIEAARPPPPVAKGPRKARRKDKA